MGLKAFTGSWKGNIVPCVHTRHQWRDASRVEMRGRGTHPLPAFDGDAPADGLETYSHLTGLLKAKRVERRTQHIFEASLFRGDDESRVRRAGHPICAAACDGLRSYYDHSRPTFAVSQLVAALLKHTAAAGVAGGRARWVICFAAWNLRSPELRSFGVVQGRRVFGRRCHKPRGHKGVTIADDKVEKGSGRDAVLLLYMHNRGNACLHGLQQHIWRLLRAQVTEAAQVVEENSERDRAVGMEGLHRIVGFIGEEA
mmetsp:Transcript_19046/g.53315  ORF Transcript_19046/g.53315 Transcript_19046/m.53315 type:complete len:256 (-) Transcript_19046:629-1396(-)